MKKKLLITGASGFLGYHLINAALLQDYEVYAGVRKSSNTAHLDKNKVTVVDLDMSDINSIKSLLEKNGISYIIHAAALTRAKNESVFNFSNAELTRNLAIAATETNIKKFIFISSLAALGPSLNGEPVNENATPHPLTWYGKSKLLAENYLREITNLPLIVLRPTGVYGPREKDLLTLIKSVISGIEIYIGRGDQKLSFVYVKDVADITIKGLQSSLNHEFYNISDGKIYDKYAFANAVKKSTGKKTFQFHLPHGLIKAVAAGMDKLYSFSSKTPLLNEDRINELTATDWSCSIEKISRELGYQPMYDLETGMAESIKWYKENKWIK